MGSGKAVYVDYRQKKTRLDAETLVGIGIKNGLNNGDEYVLFNEKLQGETHVYALFNAL